MDSYIIIDIEHYFVICLKKTAHYEKYNKKNDQITLTIDQLKTIVKMVLDQESEKGGD